MNTFVGGGATDGEAGGGSVVATPSRVAHLSSHIPSSIVSRYKRNQTPLDTTVADVSAIVAPVIVIKLYSLLNSGESTHRGHHSSYLAIIELVFQIILEEGGDILQVLNGEEIIAVWHETTSEEMSTLVRRAAKCAQKLRAHLLRRISSLRGEEHGGPTTPKTPGIPIPNSSSSSSSSGNSNNSSILSNGHHGHHHHHSSNNNNNNNNSNINSINYGIATGTQSSSTSQVNSGSINTSAHHTWSSNMGTSSNSFNYNYNSSNFKNHSLSSNATTVGGGNHNSSVVSSVGSSLAHHHHQQQQHNNHSQHHQQHPHSTDLLLSIPTNHASPSLTPTTASAYHNVFSGGGNMAGGGSSSNTLNVPSSHHHHSHYNQPHSGGGHHGHTGAFSPSGHHHLSSSPSFNSQQHQQSNGSNAAGSQPSNQSIQTANTEHLFNIFIGCGEVFLGSIGGETNSWLFFQGGEGVCSIYSIISAYDELFNIQSFPVRLSLSRQQQEQQQQSRMKSFYTFPSATTGTAGFHSTSVCYPNRVFGQIVITAATWQMIRMYSQCEPLTSEIDPAAPPMYLLKQMQEMSNPVGISVEKTLQDMQPEQLITMHRLLWCHLPMHLKVLASSSMPNSSSQPATEQFRLTQDWSLESRIVTVFILHFFDLTYNWETINFFHPVVAKLQEILRKNDGSVTKLLQRESGVFVVCVMGLPPFSNDSHAVAAIKMVMDIVKMLQSHNKHYIRDVNAMVVSEKMVCGLVGVKSRSEYVVIGEKAHYMIKWLSTVRTQTTFHIDNNNNNNNSNNSNNNGNVGNLPQDTTEGGWILCDEATRKACDKAIKFDAITYDIQFPLTVTKTNTMHPSGIGLKRSADASAPTTPTPMDNNAGDADDESLSVTFSLKSSFNSDQGGENTPRNPIYIDSANKGREFSVQWRHYVATMVTYRPIAIAHIPTTMDNQVMVDDPNNIGGHSIIGRKKEITTLMHRYNLLSERLVSSFTLIEADIGIGKSSLVTEIYKQCARCNAQVLCGSASLLEKTRAYNVFTGVFSDLFFSEFSLGETRFAGDKHAYRTLSWTRYRHVQSMPPEQIRQYIFQKFTDCRPELLPLLSLLNPVLRIDFPPNEVTAMYMGSSAMLLEKTFELLSYFLRASASRRRLVIILEDIHHMDSVSWSLLMHISFTIRPIMIIATTRSQHEKTKELNRIKKAFSPTTTKAQSPDSDTFVASTTTTAPMVPEQAPQQVREDAGGDDVGDNDSSDNDNYNDHDNDQDNHTVDTNVHNTTSRTTQGTQQQQQQQQQQQHSNLTTPLSFEYHEMKLGPLSPTAIHEIIKQQLNVKVISNYIYQLIQLKSEGNPYVCLELAKSYLERNFLIIDNKHCIVQPAYFTRGFPSMPEILERFFLSKVNHLNDFYLIILKVASVMGLFMFPYPLIHLLYPIGSKRPFLRDILQRLVDAGFLVNLKRSELNKDHFYFPPPSTKHRMSFMNTLQDQSSSISLPSAWFIPTKDRKGSKSRTMSPTSSMTNMPIHTPTSGHSPGSHLHYSASSSDDDNLSASSSPTGLFKMVRGHTCDSRPKSIFADAQAPSSQTPPTAPTTDRFLVEEDWNQYYGFKSPLLQEAMYNSLLVIQRHSLHQKIADWIEETYNSTEIACYNELLADHWSKTDLSINENLAKALHYNFAAGEDAHRRCIYFDMIKYHNEYIALFKSFKNGIITKDPQFERSIFDSFDDPITFAMSTEERIRFAISTRRIAEAYANLGYFKLSEKYFLWALTGVLKEPTPKASSTLAVSVVTMVTKQNLLKLASKNKKYQAYQESDSYMAPSAALAFETACIYSSMSEFFYKSQRLPLAVYCAMHGVQGLEMSQGASVWMALPELALACSRLSIMSALFPFCGTVSTSLAKQANKIVEDLMDDYLELGNIEATNNLMLTLAVLGLRDIFFGQWKKVEKLYQKFSYIFHNYPNALKKDKELLLFVFVVYRFVKGELNTVHTIVEECLENNILSMSWMTTLTFFHFRAMTFTFQAKYQEAQKIIIDAELLRPKIDGIEYVLHQAVKSTIALSNDQITNSMDLISTVLPMVGGGCGIRVVLSLVLISRVLLSIVERDKLRRNKLAQATVHPATSSSSSSSNRSSVSLSNRSSAVTQTSESVPIPAAQVHLQQQQTPISSSPSQAQYPKLYIVHPQRAQQQHQSTVELNKATTVAQETASAATDVNGINPPNDGAVGDSTIPPSLHTINGVQIFVDDNYNGGRHSVALGSGGANNVFELDTQEIEMWIKKILTEIKSMENTSPFSVTSYTRLNGLFMIIFQLGRDARERGLASLYKSAKEAKLSELPMEEAFAWHEISRYEEAASLKQQLAWRNATEISQKLGIDPSSLIV
ncbi:hypothetical protein SAMD00019534_032840 [Acytostelium subglobosum LB1]|uniref:hypothetical protein n=1 Tax=Acytostelium subglobosum LB1 TaxID=1410327 RepID=UPI0006447AC8|nr:hypothetical protein SAMD00019534_032840 [Acytostelium subglobosum LB1]GAM20109.1 hypothetical protein SAMD00019534_032840 [Acytostelium subglobosum LB1]|eukprot:XP_012756871.1 hypothetical protein SAMD00019534_032840 [Acytostelium subglobosum LB1]